MNIVPSCLHEGNHKRHQSRVNSTFSQRFVKRINGLDAFIPKAELQRTYLVMQERMDFTTRTCYVPVRWIAERLGKHIRTIRRHLRELSALGVVLITRRKYACRSNYENRYTFPLLDESFVSVGGDTRVTVIQKPEIERQTTPAPTAVAVAPRVQFRPRPENHGARMTHREAWALSSRHHRASGPTSTADFGTQEAWNRAHGGLSWEERNPEEAAWFEREKAKVSGNFITGKMEA